ncbi:MAG: hypothetical protein JWO67_6236 [Streptosporangiaceae bacterium]|nr:hypothetical protein [Streptosporangiaceae bacterium]
MARLKIGDSVSATTRNRLIVFGKIVTPGSKTPKGYIRVQTRVALKRKPKDPKAAPVEVIEKVYLDVPGWDVQAFPNRDLGRASADWRGHERRAAEAAVELAAAEAAAALMAEAEGNIVPVAQAAA